ncbi:hypothetical protein MUK42_35829 [Musa troglodytarum]|uniref:Uncharacterized protein n=1 Tax=Musa troglodytarum TaxID=320322 RepID=A0A9E7GCC2_9LILI|nr:hypothetical protein MUK42_35829 [Musa troglodytarum]
MQRVDTFNPSLKLVHIIISSRQYSYLMSSGTDQDFAVIDFSSSHDSGQTQCAGRKRTKKKRRKGEEKLGNKCHDDPLTVHVSLELRFDADRDEQSTRRGREKCGIETLRDT